MRYVYFDKWFSDSFVPQSPESMTRYGTDSDRYEYCECLMRTYRNEGTLSHVFEKIKELIRDRYYVDIIGIRLEPFTDKQSNKVVNTLRFGTLDSHDNEEKITDSELCKQLSDLAGIRVDSFYIANELQNFHWKFFVDSGLEFAAEYQGHNGITSIKLDTNGYNGWQIVVSCELDEELFKNKKDGIDMQIASRAYDLYDSMNFLDWDHESLNIRFTSVETECEKVMKPYSEPEVLFADKVATSGELYVGSIKKFNDARGYLFLEIESRFEGDHSYADYTDYIKFPPETTITADNISKLLSLSYELYPQYMIRKENFELKRVPLYGVEKSYSRVSKLVLCDRYAPQPAKIVKKPEVSAPAPEPVPAPEAELEVAAPEPAPEPEFEVAAPEPAPEPELKVVVPEPEVREEVVPEVEPPLAEYEVKPVFKPKPESEPEPRPKPAAQPVQPAQPVQNESIRGYKKTKYKAILPLIVLVLVLAMSRCVHTDVKKYKEDWETIASEYKRVAEPIQESSDPNILYSDIDGTETDGRYSNDYTGVAFDIPEGFHSIRMAKSPFNSSTRSADEEIEMSTFCLDEAYYFYDSNQHENIIVDLFYLPGYAELDTSAKFVLIVALNELNSFYESKSACVPATFMGEVKGYVKYYEYSDVVETRTKAIFCTYHNSIATLITINCPTRSDVDKYITLDE